jgi:hypothetical protein
MSRSDAGERGGAYRDVVAALAELGLPTVLVGTGGGHAALQVTLETGQHLLISDAEDGLSLDRDQQRGWGVGLYQRGSEFDDGPTRFESTDDDVTDMASLFALVETVLLRR